MQIVSERWLYTWNGSWPILKRSKNLVVNDAEPEEAGRVLILAFIGKLVILF